MEQPCELQTFLAHGSSSIGVSLSEDQLQQFSIYHRELITWNEKISLTAIKDTKDIAVKHFVDSLACSKALEQPVSQNTLLDIGSGPGFPGLPLKILYPELHVTLLEPNRKKTAFLRHIIGTLGLKNAWAFSKTLEQFGSEPGHHGRFLYVVTRALRIDSANRYVEGLLKDGGRFILCRTMSIGNIRNLNGLTVALEIPYDLPHDAGKRVLTVLQKSVPRGTHDIEVGA